MVRRVPLALLLVAAASSGDEVSDAADAVLEAARRRDSERLRALAAVENPDPWIVADELCDRGEEAAAQALAAAGAGPEFEALPRYLESRHGTAPDNASRKAFETAGQLAGRPEAAVRILEAADADAKGLWAVRLRFSRGFALADLHDFASGSRCLEEAAKRADALGWLTGAIGGWLVAGEDAIRAGDFARAVTCWERHLALNRVRRRPGAVAESLDNLSVAQRLLGNYAAAMDRSREALRIAEESGTPDLVARSLLNLASARTYFGEYAGALEAQERALRIRKDLGDAKLMADTLNDIGITREALGDLEGAGEALEEAIRLAGQVGYAERVAGSMDNLGLVLRSLGSYARALDCHEQALRIYRGEGQPAAEGTALLNLGIVRALTGDHGAAVKLFEEALALGRRLPYPPLEASALVDLANEAARRGDSDQQVSRLEEARKCHRAMGDAVGEALVKTSLASALRRQGRPDRALALYDEVLAFHERAGDRVSWTDVLGKMAVAREAMDDREKALSLYHRALESAEALGLVRAEVVDLWGIARAELDLQHTGPALRSAHLAIERMPLLVQGLADPEAAGAREEWERLFETGIRAALRSGDAGEICYFIESGRAMALQEALRARSTLAGTLLPRDLLEAERLARADEVAARSRLQIAIRAGRKEDEAPAREALARAREGILSATTRVQRNAKAAAGLVYPEAASLTDIRRALEEDEALVLYAVLEDRSAALVITPEGARTVELGPSAEIVEACGRLRPESRRGSRGLEADRPDPAPLDDPRSDPTATLARLKALVWTPLGIKAKRVLVSPDASLGQIPFCLIAEETELCSVPSGSSYLLLLGDRRARGRGVLALGDPATATGPSAAGTCAPSGELGRLPGSAREAEAIGDVKLIGEAATEKNLVAALRQSARWRAIHFACHAVIHPEDPLNTCLALAPDAENDGFLTVVDVFRLHAPADLVVLSACRTAQGREYHGEGMFGLTRGFMLAGAPRVLASLWKVDDQATRLLFEKFYSLWKEGSMAPATALREAQRHVREWRSPAGDRPYAHPYFWAAWVLWGLPA